MTKLKPGDAIHLIAIGGAVMHNLALDLQAAGYLISGSDDRIDEPARGRLDVAGLLPDRLGWDASRITGNLNLVVLGMHARADNPELLRAMEIGLQVYSFPELVGELTAQQQRLVVAGSHGKTTITSMVMHVLRFHRRPFDYLVGSAMPGYERMVQLGTLAPTVVLEGDEYLSSPLDPRPKMMHYQPHGTIITGIAWDHINVFPSKASYEKVFETYIASLQPGSSLIYFEEDHALVRLVHEFGGHLDCRAYKAAPYVVEDGYTFLKTSLGKIPLQVFGRHNIHNIAAARQLTALAGIEKVDFYQAIASFPGASRRLERLTTGSGMTVIRDFAHSPSKVGASVQAVAEQFGTDFTAVLELHSFSSLNPDFIPEYKGTMDAPAVAAIFVSSEEAGRKQRQSPDAAFLVKAFGRKDLKVFEELQALQDWVRIQSAYRPLLMMSSGSWSSWPWEKEISEW
jgi:UDP-N-acetylmuramate: L-alanyl-gamma-D-glutamyl-meso-diaminopimelate ligase